MATEIRDEEVDVAAEAMLDAMFPLLCERDPEWAKTTTTWREHRAEWRQSGEPSDEVPF